jgi:signal transduction histidine kinase
VDSGIKGERIHVRVKDTGIGMSREQQSTLFSFGDFHTTRGTEGEQGTGLGLMICHEFIKKHGGKLEATSQPGEGSVFTFDIPIQTINQ